MNKIHSNTLIILTTALLYSVIRYNIIGHVPITEIPLFIMNKAISFSMVIIFAFSARSYFKGAIQEFINSMSIIKGFALIHILISISLLSQQYYPKFFTNDKLSLFGNLTIFFGIISVVYILNKSVKIKNWLFFLMITLHLFFMGIKGWLLVDKWPGLMPPISLISFIITSSLFFIYLFKKELDEKN